LLRQAWKEGIDSGDAGEVNFASLKKEARARHTVAKREP
jgi:antitoxin ParD1/3/4